MSLPLRTLLVLVVATSVAGVTILDVASRALYCAANQLIDVKVLAKPGSPLGFVECVRPIMHDWLSTANNAATRGIAYASPGDEDALRFSKAAHALRKKSESVSESVDVKDEEEEEETAPRGLLRCSATSRRRCASPAGAERGDMGAANSGGSREGEARAHARTAA